MHYSMATSRSATRFWNVPKMYLSASKNGAPGKDFGFKHQLQREWVSVLRAGSHVGFVDPEVRQLFSLPAAETNGYFFDSFHTKYPFIQSLLKKGEKLKDPGSRSLFDGLRCIQEPLVLPVTILLFTKLLQQRGNDGHSEMEQKQLYLCKAAQALYLSQRFHETVRNYYDNDSTTGLRGARGETPGFKEKEVLSRWNKIATLVGDLFITEMFIQLSLVGNNEVVKIMSDALSEFSHEIFPPTNNMTHSLDSNTYKLQSSSPRYDLKTHTPIVQEPLGTMTSGMCLHKLFSCALHASSVLSGASQEQQNDLRSVGYLIGGLYSLHLRICNTSNNLNTCNYSNELSQKMGGVRRELEQLRDQIKALTPSGDILTEDAINKSLDFLSLTPESFQ